jgi:hypothetical protein
MSWLSGGVPSSAREVEAQTPATLQTASKTANDRRYLFTSLAFFRRFVRVRFLRVLA